MLRVKLVSDAQVSPDGRSVAFVVSDNYKEGPGGVVRSAIWLAELDDSGKPRGEVRPFTDGGRSDLSPRWSPTGDRLAFVSNRAGGEDFQLFTISRDGGEAVRRTDLRGKLGPGAVGLLTGSVAWSPDGREIAFLMRDSPEASEVEEDKASGGAIRFEKDRKYVRIWTLDVATGEVRKRTLGACQVWEFDWSADGKRFAAVVSDEPYEWSWYQARLAVISARTGRSRIVYTPRPRQIARPLWSRDGSSIYFLSSVWSDRAIVAGDLFMVPSAGRARATNLTHGYRGSVSWMEWASPDELILCASESAKAVIGTLVVGTDRQRRGKIKKLWVGEAALSSPYWQRFSLSPSSGTLAVGREGLSSPPEAWAAKVGEQGNQLGWSQLSNVNSHLQDLELADIGLLEWRSFDGTRVQGFLALPTGASKAAKVPMLVIVHGGPTLAFHHTYDLHNYRYPAHLLASKGFAVFMPNIRGSVGRGLRFAEANVGDMGGADFQDVMTGVDRCVSLGAIDPQRLYITGYSYGGFMTPWAITQTKRFRAAVMAAGISDWLSYHGTTEVPLWDSGHYRSDPYLPGSIQSRFSPILHVKKVRTPTLIMVGAEDVSCPPGQSHQFFRALKEMGVETELVLFPREGHGLTEKAHVLYFTERLLDWIRTH